MTCYTELIKAQKQYNNNFSLYYFGSKTNISKFVKDVETFAVYLKSQDIKRGDSFTIYLPNTIQSFAVFYALNKLGAIANVVHPLTPLDTVKQIMQSTNSKGIIVLDILANDIVSDLNNLNTQVIVAKNSDYLNGPKKLFFKAYEKCKTKKLVKLENSTTYRKILTKHKNDKHATTLNQTKLTATYIHSGGTSGETKTIKITNFAINSLSDSLSKIHTGTAGSFTPLVLPIFHAYGLVTGVHNGLTKGYNCIVFPKFNAKAVNKSIKKYKVSLMTTVPLMVSKLLQDKHFHGRHIKNLKTVYCGGDTVSITLQKDFNAAVKKQGGTAKLLAGYGLTETSSVVSVNTDENYKIGSVGKPLANVNIEIWNENKTKQRPNTIGEIVISGDVIMDGYHNSEDNGITIKNKTKYIQTGDLGYFDTEGYLYIIGRKKRLIKIASYNIFPSHVEEVVGELEFVKEVCVIESMKDNKRIIKLILSLKDGYKQNSKLTNQLLNHCSAKLIKYAVPTVIEIIDELPHTNIGKIDFVKINNLYG